MRVNHSATVGTMAEYRVIADLLSQGFEVTRPVVDNGADCHARIGGVWYSIQVKSGSARNAFGGGNSRKRIISDLVALVYRGRVSYRAWREKLPEQLEASREL